jgi:phosphoglycerol transferase MdoB-like AlkP superfamily enzyme
MKSLLGLYLKYLLYWLLIFITGRLVFLAINAVESTRLTASTLLDVFIYGFRLDLSMSAYFVFVPFLILSLSFLLFKKHVKILQNILHYILFIPALLVIVIDAQLFRYWGFKLDLTPFRFLKSSPSDAVASVVVLDVVLVVMAFIALSILGVWLYKKLIVKGYKKLPSGRLLGLVGLLLSAVLFLPIRGSVDVAPISVSSAYFHQDFYPNQAAVNPVWNFMYSLSIKDQDEKLNLASQEQVDSTILSLYGTDSLTYALPIVEQKNPNIIVIILESFSAKTVGALSDMKGLTPRLDALCDEGILFTNYYASGDRSDMGLATTFTGFPAMPNKHLLSFPQKLQTLPNLYQELGKSGYSSSFYYGGNLEFANIKTIFVTAGVQNIMTEDEIGSFPDDGKWGAHDHHVFQRFADDLAKQKQPFVASIFSLSSHEPYKVPADFQKFEGTLADFSNATYYTDSCLGALVDQLKRDGIWGNSLLIVTADHATRMPDMSAVNDPNKFRIPLLLTGGVIDSSYQMNNHCSQSDFAYSILELLGKQPTKEDYPFSKSIFNTQKDFAFYFYNKGVGYLDSSGSLIYDINGKYSLSTPNIDSLLYLRRAKAMTQAIDQNFTSR